MSGFSSSFSLFGFAFWLIILFAAPFIVYFFNKNSIKEQRLKRTLITFTICFSTAIIFIAAAYVKSRLANPGFETTEKPVIYLYPRQATNVSVTLKYGGILTCTYPDYKSGWSLTAYPDGELLNSADNRMYRYLYWEGKTDFKNWDMTKGFVVPGKDTERFLKKILPELGLSNNETNDFIVYWLPKMQMNKFNLIHFADNKEYGKLANLVINPKPDSVIRVFMVYKPLNKRIDIPPQSIKSYARKGFTAVEWGGTEYK